MKIVFDGYISGEAKKYFIKRSKMLGVKMILFSLLSILPVIVCCSLYFKSLTKVEFDMKNQYVYKVIHDDGTIKELKIVASSIQDYLNNNLVEYKENIVKSNKSKIMFVLHWLIVIIICIFISLLIIK